LFFPALVATAAATIGREILEPLYGCLFLTVNGIEFDFDGSQLVGRNGKS
jgi:hypothetical protein